jgi:hypothetical protein
MEVDAEQPAAQPPLCIEGFGFDTGWVNAGAAGGRFLGWLDMVDEATGETRRELKLEVMALENWDLTTAVITRIGTKAKSCVRVPMRETRAKSDHMQDWIEAMALMIAQSDWIFATHRSMLDAGEARLPFLIVENQFDHIKSDYVKTQNREICNITAATVLGHDFRAARERRADPQARGPLLPPRLDCRGMGKHGQRCDGSRERLGRKEQAVADTKNLLAAQQSENGQMWLDHLLYMESVGEQIHDQCDALMLLVQKMKNLVRENAKCEMRELRKMMRLIPEAPIRKKRAPKMKDRVEDSDEFSSPGATQVEEGAASGGGGGAGKAAKKSTAARKNPAADLVVTHKVLDKPAPRKRAAKKKAAGGEEGDENPAPRKKAKAAAAKPAKRSVYFPLTLDMTGEEEEEEEGAARAAKK